MFLLVALLAFGACVYFIETAEAPTDELQENGRVMDVETYVRQNISTISTEPPVLGGTWQVTNVVTKDGRGTVWYEDGHIALVADFEYTIDKYGITISMFTVRN